MDLRNTTDQEKEVLEWLNDIRESGGVNMASVSGDIRYNFNVSKVESRRLLALWMKNFNDSGSYQDVIKE